MVDILVVAHVLTPDGMKKICVGNGPVKYLKVWYKDKPCQIVAVQEMRADIRRG